MKYSLNKTKYMVVKKDEEKEQEITEKVKTENILELFWSECGKMRTRITPNTDIFYAVTRVLVGKSIHGHKI